MLKVRITGTKGKDSTVSEAHVHPFKIGDGHSHHGLVVLTYPFIQTESSTIFFLNETNGSAMNQAVTFGTTGNVLHDGGSTSSALTGTADTNTLNKLEDSGAPFEAGAEDDGVLVGMTVENTTDSSYARISAIDSTSVLSLTDIDSKGVTAKDAFPAGTENYTINAVWTGAATIGTWDFSTDNVITQAGANNNDQCDITGDALDKSWADDFTALTGAINLNTYSEGTNDITIQMTLAGVAIGDSVGLNTYIDTTEFAAQNFVIPIGDFNIGGQLFNGIRIIVTRSGGSKPAFTLDNIRTEFSGVPLTYELNLTRGERFNISELVFTYADALVSEKTGLADVTETFTNPFLSYDAILGLAALSNGFVITRKKKGKTLFSVTIKTLGAQISVGATIGELVTDNANTFITLRFKFPDPLILTGDPDDSLTITINDDMSGLLQFTAVARGALEI